MCLACQLTTRMHVVQGELHPVTSEWVWSELGVLRERHALADHPYMVAVRRGGLRGSELALLATEQDHVVVAMAAAVRRLNGIVSDEAATIAEEAIDAWRAFAGATGWNGMLACFYGQDPFPETVALARCVAGHDTVAAAAAVARLYALRVAQLDVAPMIALAVSEHHAMAGDETAWFGATAGNDRLATLLGQALRTALAGDPFVVLAAARETLEALWRFYDRLEACRVEAERVVA